ncbi:hypothetical protein ACGF5I_05580 [Streptomyces bobili]
MFTSATPLHLIAAVTQSLADRTPPSTAIRAGSRAWPATA